jgi:hydrogenase-4 component H
MKYPKLRELREAVKALIKGPYTSGFPFKPHQPFAAFRGRPKFSEDECVGCTACAQVCPAKAIEWCDDIRRKKRILTVRWDLCIFCGQCQANCLSVKGIQLSLDFDLATLNRQELYQTIEKDLVLCECCSEVIAPREQIIWVAEKLGALLFSNASLMLYYLQDKGLSDKGGPHLNEPVLRADRLRILCPACRRKAIYKS